MNVAPTPLEILQLAETRRHDPELALRMADQSGKEHDNITKDKETKNAGR